MGVKGLTEQFFLQSHAPERMYYYHAGPITGLETSPVAHFVATIGVDRELLFSFPFLSGDGAGSVLFYCDLYNRLKKCSNW